MKIVKEDGAEIAVVGDVRIVISEDGYVCSEASLEDALYSGLFGEHAPSGMVFEQVGFEDWEWEWEPWERELDFEIEHDERVAEIIRSEEYNLAQELYGECATGDYKDFAESTYCACRRYVDSGKASPEFMEWFDNAPDGISCPRAWMDYGF